MNILKLGLILFLTFLSTGCSYFYPDYERPKTEMPERWNSQNKQVKADIVNLPYLAWWHDFDDPELNQLIEQALVENSTVKTAIASIKTSQNRLNTVKLSWLPMVSLFGGYLEGRSNSTFANIGSVGAIAGNGGFLAIIPSYTINLFTTYARQKQAEFQLEVTKNNELNVRLGITSQVVMSYFAYLAQVEAVKILTELDQDYSELLQTTKNMDKQGLATDITISEIKAQQRNVAGQLAISQSNLIMAQNAIQSILGKVPGSVSFSRTFQSINANHFIPGNLPVSVIESRPDILKAESELKAANAGIKLSSSALLPTVSLNYFYARSKGSVDAITNESISNKQGTFSAFADWTVSPEIIGSVGVASSVYDIAVLQYQETVNNALHDVDNALANNESYNSKMKFDDEAYQSIEESTDLKQALYKQGLISYSLLLAAQIERLTFKLDLTSTKLEQLATLVKLYGALGGGYLYKEQKIVTQDKQQS